MASLLAWAGSPEAPATLSPERIFSLLGAELGGKLLLGLIMAPGAITSLGSISTGRVSPLEVIQTFRHEDSDSARQQRI